MPFVIHILKGVLASHVRCQHVVSVWMLLNCCNKPTYVRCYYQMRQMVQRLVNLIVTSSHLGMRSWEFKYGLVYGYGVNQFGGKDGKEKDNARAF